MAAAPLASLTRIARQYGPGLATRKLELLAGLDRARLRSADQVFRLHELLCYLVACPDDRRIHARARRMLHRFAERPDLRRQRARLVGSGIAGTDTPYRFFWPTADWLRRSWPGRLHLDRPDPEGEERLRAALPLLLTAAQAEWLRESRSTPFDALDVLRPPGLTDAEFLLGLIAGMPGDDHGREQFGDGLDLSYRLEAGPGTPERSTARCTTGPVHYQKTLPDTRRPELRVETRRAPQGTRALRGRAARQMIELARICMVTRERDLAAFQFADPADVFVVDDGGGLAFALMGTTPARRALLPAIYGALMLRNGVPVGYVQLDLLGRHAALSVNTFATFRGTGTALLFARLLAVARHVFGCDEFSIEPYQLGEGNEEGIESGAWWFYYRLGFRPRAAEARRLAARELGRKAANSRYRSAAGTLRKMARWHMFLALEPGRQARLPRTAPWLDAAAGVLRHQADPDPRRRTAGVVAAALRTIGPASRPRLAVSERIALERWAPLVLAIPDLHHWSVAERRALWRLILAKGGRSERDFQIRLLQHSRLRAALDC